MCGEKQDKAFCDLQWCLTHAPVLALLDLDAPYEVVCDACGYGLGVVLLQNEKPIAFHTYKLNDAEQRYPVGEQELLAVITALRQWRCYLEGAKGGVTIVTDHKPNTYLDSKPAIQLSSRQVRWEEFLSRFHFERKNRKGVHTLLTPLVETLLCTLCTLCKGAWSCRLVGGPRSIVMLDSLCLHAISVKEASPPMKSLLVCCNHCLYLSFVGKVCLWISVLNSLRLKQAILQFWCL